MIRKLLKLFIYFSFIAIPIGGRNNTDVILSRITFSDIFGAIAIFFGINIIFQSIYLSIKINKIYLASLLLLFIFFLEIFFSLNKISTLVETIILFFLILISTLIFYSFKDNFNNSLLPTIINTILIASIIGFYDYIANLYGLFQFFPQRVRGEFISGFRNAGQAGAYFMIFLTILYPLKNSKIYHFLSKKNKIKLNITIIISTIFLFSTGKIAAWIGYIIGVILFTILTKKITRFIFMSILGIILFFVFQNLEQIAPDLAKRLDDKVRTRIIEQVDGTSNDDFLQKNWGGAIRAFMDNPLTGTGQGAFVNNYDIYEIHSTYLKMIGESGLFGAIFYIIFVFFFLSLLKIPKNFHKSNPYYDYLHKISPFIFGCFVSWSYTYHLRKREFWIMIAILLIIRYQAKLYENKKIFIKIHDELSNNL